MSEEPTRKEESSAVRTGETALTRDQQLVH